MERIKNTESYELYKYEYILYDTDEVITFNLIDIDIIQKTIAVEVTNCGRLRPVTFDLYQDNMETLQLRLVANIYLSFCNASISLSQQRHLYLIILSTIYSAPY